jgi:hypothetical protein
MGTPTWTTSFLFSIALVAIGGAVHFDQAEEAFEVRNLRSCSNDAEHSRLCTIGRRTHRYAIEWVHVSESL